MEGKLLNQRIPISQIEEETPYGFRFDLRDPVLEASLAKRGILFPLLVIQHRGRKAILIAGHKRFDHARRQGWDDLPVTWVEEDFSEKEFFLLSLYSNWGQQFSDLDRMRVLERASAAWKFTEKELLGEVLPVLGLPASRGVLEDYGKAAGLSSELHDLIHRKHLSFRGVSSLSRFSPSEQKELAERVFSFVHLTSNQLMQIAERLFDLKKIKRVSLESLLHEESLQAVLRHPGVDLRAKGEKFLAAVRALRRPRQTARETQFQKIKREVEENRNLHLHPPEDLEQKNICVTARLQCREDLQRVLRFLEAHRPSLDALFED